jgi:hypothetical protein
MSWKFWQKSADKQAQDSLEAALKSRGRSGSASPVRRENIKFNLNKFLKPGDIMLKHYDSSFLGGAIKLGQAATGQGAANFIHAGIASPNFSIIEMDGNGLQENFLADTHYDYDVYRIKSPAIAARAAEAAVVQQKSFAYFKANGQGLKIEYALWTGAVKSLGKIKGFDKGNTKLLIQNFSNTAGIQAYFCSGHVVLCYCVAMHEMQVLENYFPASHARQLFSMSASCYNPSELAMTLAGNPQHWQRIGTFKKGFMSKN